jgi:hypothetical protein
MRNMAWWGKVGEGAIAVGCLGAAVSGAGAWSKFLASSAAP